MFIDTKGKLKGLELSCKKCTISKRCQNCDKGNDALENFENLEDFENFEDFEDLMTYRSFDDY